MDLRKLLSVVMAVLTALGAILLALGQSNPWSWSVLILWLAVVLSLAITDFLGYFRLPRNQASLLAVGVMLYFLPSGLRSSGEARLLVLAEMLIYLQVILLFQEKDERVFWWLAVMSLLQTVVAAGFSAGLVFGILLVAYTLIGMFGLALIVLYGQWQRAASPLPRSWVRGAWGKGPGVRPGESGSGPLPDKAPPVPPRRWPLADPEITFTATPGGNAQAGLGTEFLIRMAFIALGGMLLMLIIFIAVPRPKGRAFRGSATQAQPVVGFNQSIALGQLGELLESRQEVLQLKLYTDSAEKNLYPLREDVYLRGATVVTYNNGEWSREQPPATESFFDFRLLQSVALPKEVVVQDVTMDPDIGGRDLFYIYPIVEPASGRDVTYAPESERLVRSALALSSGEGPKSLHFKVGTSGLVDGHLAQLVPAGHPVDVGPLLQSPALPRLTELAARWVQESKLPPQRHLEIARTFERNLSGSGQFEYSLKGEARDPAIDAIEDFVSAHPRGHCEYFATALALMLRSQGIPSRVVLGYRCDEWDEVERCYQVRQLHAHAWVEAYLDAAQIPESLRRGDVRRWANGGWLRVDGTPPGTVGSLAANRSTWGSFQDRFRSWQHAWDKYVIDMDRQRQQAAIYRPISRAVRGITASLSNPGQWREILINLWTALAKTARSGIMGFLLGLLAIAAFLATPIAVGWLLWRVGRMLWQRFVGKGGRISRGSRSSVEFYRRFEQIVQRLGLRRIAGQTPREFAHVVGDRLVAMNGRREQAELAMQVVEAYYRVRFGRQKLDPASAQSVERALAELTAGTKSR